jgi:predicted nucleic acid-binding protein
VIRFLLDTNVVSELAKAMPDRAVTGWLDRTRGNHCISVLVLGELQRGVELQRRRNPGRAQEFDRWAARLARDYSDRTLPVITEIALTWGRLNAVRPLPRTDGLMAATALVHDLTLVTRNVKDFAGLDVDLLDPFEG